MKMIDKLIALELYMQDEHNRQRIIKEFNEWSKNRMENNIGRFIEGDASDDTLLVQGVLTTSDGYSCYLCEFVSGERNGEVIMYSRDKIDGME